MKQNRTVAGQDRCRTGQKQDTMDVGQDDARQNSCRTGQMQDRSEAGQDGCRK